MILFKDKHKSTGFLLIPLLISFNLIFISQINAQVAISVGLQQIYDDNIFLENDRRPPANVVFNTDLESLLEQGELGNSNPVNFDGTPNDDFITNAFLGFAGDLPFLQYSVDSEYDFEIGTLIFAEFSEQNRLTLDGSLETSLSNLVLPDPYYLTIRNTLTSASNNVGASSSAAALTTQNYILNAETGIRKAKLSTNSSYSLGYIGSYQKFLGDFTFGSDSNSDVFTNFGGVDFHSHMATTSLDYKVSRDLEIGLTGTGGVQLFTDIDTGDFGGEGIDPENLDRNNAELQFTTQYTITNTLYFDGSVGVGYSELRKDPDPITVTFTNDQGETVSEERQLDSSNTGLTFLGSLNYAYRPGSLFTIGASQGFTTNIDGQRFINRVGFLNISEPLTEDLMLVLGSSYMQFENESNTSPDFNRFEGTASLNYHLNQNTALMAGYNFTTQSADSEEFSGVTRFLSPDFTSNRLFIGISTGFVGLPL